MIIIFLFYVQRACSMSKIKLPKYDQTVLICQGGGALGSYQAGAYEALHNAGIEPTWVAGISIGAMNSAIIAGNAPKDRAQKLHDFWNTICRPPSIGAQLAQETLSLTGEKFPVWHKMFDTLANKTFGSFAATQAILHGQDGFFVPKPFAPGVGTPASVSFYDTTPLITTLERFADFDRINDSKEMRVSLGTTNVGTGNFTYFDNTKIRLTPLHFLASGALPPGFPAVEIDGEFYWDGGCVSNTPLSYIMTEAKNDDLLIFQVDLWSAKGNIPTNIFQVEERLKDIQYSSRTRSITETMAKFQDLRQIILRTLDEIPAEVKAKNPWFAEAAKHTEFSKTNVIHLIYQEKKNEGHYKDYQFSRETKNMHWAAGIADVENTLQDPTCLNIPTDAETFVTYDIHRKMRFTPQTPDPEFPTHARENKKES